MKRLLTGISFFAAIIAFTSCELNIIPSDALTGSQIRTTSDGLTSLVNGGYSQFKDIPSGESSNNWYLRQYFQLSDFASDDIVCGYKTEDDLINSFRYNDRAAEKTNINSFWEVSYKIIYGANVGISMADQKGSDPLTDQLKGECYFLRAFATHSLVKLFAKPYSASNGSQPGVILRESSSDGAPKARATLTETYDYILSSLKTAASLMSGNPPEERNNRGFASKYAAWALLSRVYLYMDDYQNASAYADSVINSGAFSLETPDSYPGYFANAPGSAETIWCIPFLAVDDKKEASVASMVYNGANCWGEEGASPSILSAMGFGTDMMNVDVRWKYIETAAPGLKNGVNIYYVGKFSGQGGSPTLSSPVMIRLAEVYLNRAEAQAKLGNVEGALADVNGIRTNRMAVPDGSTIDDYLYDATRDGINAGNILDYVLKERRIELAFEGHRIFDLIRNGKDLERNYWGYHLDSYNGIPGGSQPGIDAPGALIPAGDPRFVYPIPSSEESTNKLCVPNNK
ncbi:MAG TPA: RagB/SusD family nutrient uptake outer membrane protein [Bacteroidales bacterium]|nr:RagB/SusD family nutrient uptake outer membrane protein [Bacteroidales bacterium]